MFRKNMFQKVIVVSFIVLLSICMFAQNTSAIIPNKTKAWYWTSDTDAPAVLAADVDGDSAVEIVSGGYYNDGSIWVAQLAVWSGSTMALENVRTWSWTSNTEIKCVAAGDVDGDGGIEIVTGGAYFDNTRWVAQLAVWNGSTLALENVRTWYWTSNTVIQSVAVANITGGLGLDIVTGGSFFDGTRNNAQLVTWSGPTLGLENVRTWYWGSDTYINSVAVANVDADPALEIVTGGAYFSSSHWNAQLCVWSGSTLTLKNVKAWYWFGDTDVSSVTAGNIDADASVEIITGGSYFDGTRNNAQLVVWDGSTLSLKNVKTWYFTSNTMISSVAFGDVNSDGQIEVVTGGKYFDGNRFEAQITVQPGSNLAGNVGANWFWTSDTFVESIAINNLGTINDQIITSGGYYDLTRSIAQLTVWG